MATATSDRISTDMMVLEGNPKAKMLTHKVRVHFVAKANKELNIRMTLHALMRRMVDAEKSTTFKDILGNEINLSTFDYDLEKFKEAFGLVSNGGKKPQAVVGFEINSPRTWSSYRYNMFETLKGYNAWLKPHKLETWNSIDMMNAGHVMKKNARFVDAEALKATLKEELLETAKLLAIKDEFPTFYNGDEVVLPEFYFQHGRVTTKHGNRTASWQMDSVTSMHDYQNSLAPRWHWKQGREQKQLHCLLHAF